MYSKQYFILIKKALVFKKAFKLKNKMVCFLQIDAAFWILT